MAHDELGPADFDRLADYIGGALDGPDAVAVARLIADDPQWRATYELLAPGMAAVGAELHALGTAPEPMPADLAARLDEAFASPGSLATDSLATNSLATDSFATDNLATDSLATDSLATDSLSTVAEPTVIDPELAEPREPHLAPVRGDRHLSVVPDSTTPGDAEPGDAELGDAEPDRAAGGDSRVRSRRRRRMRWAVPVAAAAGVLAFAGIGIDYLAGQTGGSADQATSAAGSNAERTAPMIGTDSADAAPAIRDDQILETGTNYTAASLGAALPAASTRDLGAAPKAQASPGERAAMPPAGDLARLHARDALQACIEAIAQVNASGPITVETVDYARYAGRPALVVRFTAAGLTWVYAAGPNCGTPNLGADLRNRVQVR